MKSLSKRKFIFCSYYEKEVPHEETGCCEFYNTSNHRCDYKKYVLSSKKMHLSEREELYNDFSSHDEE